MMNNILFTKKPNKQKNIENAEHLSQSIMKYSKPGKFT
jgi:hypothetical protein